MSATGNYAQINVGAGNDSILVEGNSANINGDAENDVMIVNVNVGNGEDTIIVSGANVNVYGGTNFDTLPLPDTFQVNNTARNVIIKNFEKSADRLLVTGGDIVVNTQTSDEISSFIIMDAQSYDTIAVLEDVAESEFDNITFTNENEEPLTTSIN